MTRIQKYTSIGAAVLAALWGTAKVQAFDPQQESPGFGPMSIHSGQTARVAAFCIDRNSFGGFPPGPCDVAFSFRSIHGTTLGQTRMTLAPGTGGFFDLPVGPGTDGNRGGDKFELIPCVIPAGTGHSVSTVEVFDTASGRTVFFSNAAVPALSFLAGLGR